MENTSNRPQPRARVVHQRRGFALVAAFFATMLAFPSAANITIPDQPLTLGARIPPNILFILDNSGSMGWDYLPDSVPAITTHNIASQAYTRNVIYYNPHVDYEPWVDSTGATMTGGTSYDAAYSHNDLVAPFSTATIDLSSQLRTFYVPRYPTNPATFGDVSGYYRYQIYTDGTIERSEWDGGAIVNHVVSGYPLTSLSGTSGAFRVLSPTFTVPANTTRITVTATGAAGANLYMRVNNAPTTGNYTSRVVSTAVTKNIDRTNPVEGEVIHVGLHGRTGGYSNVTVTITYQVNDPGCSGFGWTACEHATPTGRSVEAELQNFATWYSYHRTRMKVAKSSAGRAFAEVGPSYRVGYRNIYNNMPNGNTVIPGGGVWPTGGRWNTHPITRDKPIPVTRNAGLFDDPNGTTGANNNKTAWYQRLYAQTNSGSTPLRLALWEAGEYFKNTDNDGPYGPGTGNDQYSCRLNYTLMTTDGYRNDENNASLWDAQIGEEDSVAGTTITGPSGTFTYTPANPFSSPHSGNLGDIAMHYWKNDLRPDLRNVVPTSDANPAFWQHMVTFGVTLGAAGTLNPETDLPHITSGSKVWPYHTNNNPASIDDFWHATVNGRGKFIVATDGNAFVEGLRGTLSEISGREGSFSNVAANSVSLDTGAQVFSASYWSGSWIGQLVSRDVTSTGVGGTAWTASLPSWSLRKVFTSNGTSGQTFPTSAQQLTLARGGGEINFAVTGEENVNYIKGDGSNEERNGGVLRNRTTPLGDIIGSSPAYVADTKTLYVGANDGMLHAFDATDGKELFAYIPNMINWGNLSTLSRGDYAHRYFVDGPIAVTSRAMTPSKNFLVGSLGRGGKGLYALDVTNPATVNAAGVFKWERAETPENNMGFVLGKPLLSGLSNGKVAAVVGNGVNSTNNKAVLLVIDTDTGNVIREIDTNTGSDALPNGLSTPTGVYGMDGKTLAYVYAGDLLGNVWKFDLTSSTPADWKAHKLFAAGGGNGSQPISGGVTVATHPRTFKRWVFFGTGRYLTAEDADPLLSNTTQSMYGFMEDDTDTLVAADLTQRTFKVTGEEVNDVPVRAFEARTPLPADSQGWYVDLPGVAERIVQDAQVVSGYLITASMTPTGDACEPAGSGYINALDAFTGTSPGAGSFFDLDGKPDTASVVDGLPVGSIGVGVGMPTLPNILRGRMLVSGTNAGLASPAIVTPQWDRVSWREIRRE